jgi:hypothetical protein
MAIAWREALANSIIHGNHENPGLSCMRLALRIPSRVYLPFLPLSSNCQGPQVDNNQVLPNLGSDCIGGILSSPAGFPANNP